MAGVLSNVKFFVTVFCSSRRLTAQHPVGGSSIDIIPLRAYTSYMHITFKNKLRDDSWSNPWYMLVCLVTDALYRLSGPKYNQQTRSVE